MTQAAAAQTTVSSAPVVTDQVKIAYLDRAKQTVRLIFLTGFDKDHNLEYSYKTAVVDSRIRTGNVPIICVRQGEKLVSLQFRPGQEPAQSAGAPVSQAKPAEEKPAEQPKKDEEKPKEESPKQEEKSVSEPAKKIVPYIINKGKNFLILGNTTEGEVKYELIEKAAQYQSSFIEGDYVNFSLKGGKIYKLWKVDENGVYHKKEGFQGNQKPQKTITLGGTINLQNYENIKIEVSGPYETVDDVKKYLNELKEIALLFGKDEVTKGFVQNWCKRVIGGQ